MSLTPIQQPKYDTNEEGKLVNRLNRLAIPDNEPFFIIRASDIAAIDAVKAYGEVLASMGVSTIEVDERLAAFERFKKEYLDQMRLRPD